MRRIYLDSDYKCHLESTGALASIETDFFDGKCDAYVEGFRFIPAGETWTREDGQVFQGEMVAPWVEISKLDAAQRQYERQQLADMRLALEIMGVTV